MLSADIHTIHTTGSQFQGAARLRGKLGHAGLLRFLDGLGGPTTRPTPIHER
jgi:hypothetical protein